MKLGPHMDSRLMYHVYLNLAAHAYLSDLNLFCPHEETLGP